MIVRIDPSSAVPFYEQIARLSTWRYYERLRPAGIIDTRRGRSGAIVAAATSRINDSEMGLVSMTDVLIGRAKEKGVERQRLFELIGESW